MGPREMPYGKAPHHRKPRFCEGNVAELRRVECESIYPPPAETGSCKHAEPERVIIGASEGISEQALAWIRSPASNAFFAWHWYGAPANASDAAPPPLG